ncbi:MAG: hypothetical protein M0R17_10100 [Candidatus Omnitrophica bacterium]|jgi:hypothetical protein|nr:hypothetical protein [Candidatus Omnitrophota bacterium]
MATYSNFSCPILIQKLQEQYGYQEKKEDLPFRKSRDVSEFIKAKEESEKKSHSAKVVFK